MPLSKPLRYINNGEPLNEVVLNRALIDVSDNLEELFSRIGGARIGVPEAEPDTVVRRDDNGVAEFGEPTSDKHPLRSTDVVNNLDSDQTDRPLSASMGKQISDSFEAQLDSAFPIGSIIMYPGDSNSLTTDKWTICDGGTLPRDGYPELFNVIGTMYGDPNDVDFNIPDLRSEFVRGADNGRNEIGGHALGTSQADEFKSHTHTLVGNDLGGSPDQLTAPGLYADDAENAAQDDGSIQNAGGEETRPRNVALNYIIKIQ